MGLVDRALGRLSPHRAATCALLAVHAAAALLGALGRLDVAPEASAATVAAAAAGVLLIGAAGAATTGTRVHIESALVTALVIALVVEPSTRTEPLVGAGLVGAAAGLTKLLVRARGRHLLNPAAAALVVAGLLVAPTLGVAAPVWWVAVPELAPVVLVSGALLVRRTGTGAVAFAYVLAHLGATAAWAAATGGDLPATVRAALLGGPVLVVALFVVVEPLTQPARRVPRIAVAALAGALPAVPLWLGPAAMTPELAVVVGNVVTALVAAPRAVQLVVERHTDVGSDAHEVTLRPRRALRWHPGQWVELDVGRCRPDGRGRRRALPLVPAGESLAVAVTKGERPSGFASALVDAPVGSVVRATAVAGDFLLPRDPTVPVLMVTSGIGVSAFLAHLEHAGPRDIVLVVECPIGLPPPYAARLARTRARVVVVSPEPVPHLPARWTWFEGTRLTAASLEHAMSDLPRRRAYLAGAPDLVRRARRVVRSAGVRRVRTLVLHGYDRPPARRRAQPAGAVGDGARHRSRRTVHAGV